MRKIEQVIVLILSLWTIIALGQVNSSIIQNAVNSTAAKSPDAAALFRYTEVPVSLYTGIPDISIPLYTIKEGDIEVPISITYHAGGIKVTDEASSVGLGWNLNVGGRVSHTVAGANDFSLYGYYNIYPKNAIGSGGSVSICPTLPWNTSTQTNAFYSNFFLPYNSDYGNIYIDNDFQPDQFLINLPNKSYKAYLDMSKTVKPNSIKFAIAGQPNINFKLMSQPSVSGSYTFQVTDEFGINYSFDKGERSTTMVGGYSISGLSRFLTKIEDVKGNLVNFYYSENTINDRLSGCKNTRTDYTYNPNVNLGWSKENGLTECSKLKVDESFIEKIEFSNGKIEFVWSEREDISNSKKLSSIKIYNKYKLIRQFDFNYDYFIATDNLETSSLAPWLGGSNNKIFTHRLRLLNLTESLKNEKYSFEYNSTYNLPNKLSFSTDFWGYYNGQNNSDTFIPDPGKYIKGENVFNVTSFTKDHLGYWYQTNGAPPSYNPNDDSRIFKNFSPDGKHYLSDRRASLYSLANMLTVINYPTGGKTEYEYEPNTFSNFPMQSLLNDNTRKEVNSYQNINIINGNAVHSGGVNDFSVIGSNIKLNIGAKFDFYFVSNANGAAQSFWIYIKDKSTGQVIKKVYNPNVGSYQGAEANESIILQSGNYEIGTSYNSSFTVGNIIQPNNSSSINNTYHIDYVNEKSIINNIEHNYSSGGGVRIKSIKSTEKPGSTPVIKNYIYDEVSNDGTKITSYGNLADFPKFFEIENRCYNYNNSSASGGSLLSNPGCTMNLNTPQSPNNYPFKISVYEGTPGQGTSTLPQGNHIGYSKVIEEEAGKGRTESYFFNKYNQSCIMMAQRGASLIIGDGDMTQQSIYDSSSNLIKETIYKYKFNYPDNLNTYFIPASILEPITSFEPVFRQMNPTGNTASFGGIIHHYSINLYKSLLESTTTKEYFPGGSSTFIETKNLTTYNNKYQPSIQKTTYSDLSSQETTFNYAQEKGNQLLISKNIVEIPLETTVKRTNDGVTKTVSKTETIYPTSLPDSQIGNFILPKSVKTYDLSNNTSAITEVTLDKYDTKGNLIQYSAKDGTPVTVVWGYNSTLPIAKIEGAKFDNIATYINDIITASDTDALNPTSEQALLNVEDNFRRNISLANYQITTYTHDPLIGITSITPSSGITEYYKYDTANRLEKIVDSNNKILKEFKYRYATNSINFSNSEKSQTFIRNNCTGNTVGGSYTYIVPAGTYTDVSKLAADQKALDDINANGQNMANQNGPCLPIVSCAFTFIINPQYSYNSTNTTNNTVNFYVSFSSYGIWQSWTNGINIGKVGASCTPSVNREITYSEGGRQWKIFIDTVGNCTLKLISGTVDPSSSNPLNFNFQYQK